MRERNAIKIIDKNRRQESDINNLRKRVAELEAAQRWIPVKERKPENDDYVLCYPVIGYIFVGEFTGKRWYENEDVDMTDYVTHWMPLPLPLPPSSAVKP